MVNGSTSPCVRAKAVSRFGTGRSAAGSAQLWTTWTFAGSSPYSRHTSSFARRQRTMVPRARPYISRFMRCHARSSRPPRRIFPRSVGMWG